MAAKKKVKKLKKVKLPAKKDTPQPPKPESKKLRPGETPKPVEPTRVFLDRNRHVFILLEQKDGYGEYLGTRDGQIDVVKIEDGHKMPSPRDGKLPDETTHRSDLKEYEYPFKQAMARLNNSYLPKTRAAVVQLCTILGLPIPEETEEVKARRKAAGDRLKAARPERVGFTVQQLCEKLKIEPTVARKLFRKAKIEKPQAGWVWESEAEAMEVAKKVGLVKEEKPKKEEKEVQSKKKTTKKK